jgi:hypothetical protein
MIELTDLKHSMKLLNYFYFVVSQAEGKGRRVTPALVSFGNGETCFTVAKTSKPVPKALINPYHNPS